MRERMVPRLLFAAMVFGSLASRPDTSRRHAPPPPPAAQAAATVRPAPAPAASNPHGS
jgi:hypothetical protein